MKTSYSKPVPQSAVNRVQDAVATAEVSFSLGQREAQVIVENYSSKRRSEFATGFCSAVLALLWNRKVAKINCSWPCREEVTNSTCQFPGLIDRVVTALAVLPNSRAGFLIGQLYTALLPDLVRKALGAYYTPPPLVDRLLDLVDESGFNWSRGRIVDPACGGAAFLASLAPKLAAHSNSRSPEAILSDIESRLMGIEVDPFAAWMSMVLLDVCMLDIAVGAGRRLKPLVSAQDALDFQFEQIGKFDLVIGNPPYGKVSLKPAQRERFKGSLFGHANLYGVFTEIAVRLSTPQGLIAFVTPTSFLGGQYFKNLRRFLCENAPLSRLDFVKDRNGVFNGVLQETMLALFQRKPTQTSSQVYVNVIRATEAIQPVTAEPIGTATLNARDGSPWLLPRSQSQMALTERFSSMNHRLVDYGYAVSTGQLVWNRHKSQLRTNYGRNCYPIVWAEAVNADGTFHFQAARRAHLPYLKIEGGQDFLVNQEPCILVQRTTAKEQKRRLIAAVIPNSFVLDHPGFVVENHLNMVYSRSAKLGVALRTIATLLNSTMLDQAFRCVSGSVAVSAYELNSLPLPNPEQMLQLQEAVLAGASLSQLEDMVAQFYAAPNERNTSVTSNYSRQRNRRVAA